MGFRLCGIAELPFCPARNASDASRTSVRCRWRISVAIISIDEPTEAQAKRYSAWRSRAMTWVAGTGFRPSARHTSASTEGSMLE